jgi:hypothetical protein
MAQVDATKFDPYYKWLSIPPHEQPPNFYRLLGIELFEEDADVIAAAADRQMGHVKSFAAGKYASHSQRLLNELAEARICLLSSDRKSRYVRQLKQELAFQETVEKPLSAQRTTEGASAQAAGIVDPPLRFARAGAQNHRTDPISIRTEPRSYSRRKNSLGQNVVRLLFFFGTLIPTIIIAYRIDLINPEPRQVVVPQQPPVPQQVVVQQRSQSATSKSRPKEGERRPIEPVQETPPEIERETSEIQPNDDFDHERTEREPRAHDSIVLNLETKMQRGNVSLTGPVRVARLNGVPHTIKPTDGSLANGQVKVSINGPRPIVLTVEMNDRRQILITPTVDVGNGKEIAFTSKTIDPLLRRMMKAGEQAVRDLNAMKAERARLQAWLDSSLLKPLADVRTATARVKELDVLIREGELTIQAMEVQAKGISELAEFAKHLHDNAELVIESID